MTASTEPLDRTPWEALPAELATLFRPRIDPLAAEIVETIRETVPAYRRPLDGAFGHAIRTGARRSLEQFVDMLEVPPTTRQLPERQLYVDLGRGEAREGRTLDALLSAYRIGARLSWRRIAAEGREAGLDSNTLALLAEGIFAYIDELSAASAEGWAEEQSATASELERRRSALVALLTQSPPAEPAAVEDAARAADWALPQELVVLVWSVGRRGVDTGDGAAGGRRAEPDASDDARQRRRRAEGPLGRAPAGARRPPLPPASIATTGDDGATTVVVPDPGAPTRRAQLERALAGRVAAIGPVTPWPEAWRSARRARAAHRLALRGALPAGGLVAADGHLPALLLHTDPTLLAELAERALAPLTHRSPAARRRLADTLRALIDHGFRAPDAAAALHVHPQTVRYRLAQLREDFGDLLDDPDRRFELSLALRAP